MKEAFYSAILSVLLSLHPAVGPVAILAHTATAAPIVYGYQTIGSNNSSITSGFSNCNGITTGPDALGYTLVSLSAYTNEQSAGTTFMSGAVYAGSGTSGTLVTSSGSSGAISLTPTWITVPLSGTLAASTYYKICFSGSANLINYYDSTTGDYYYNGNVGFFSWFSPGTWSEFTGMFSNSLYITVTPN